ncbi:MAG: type II toxin-antitoxin system HicB family antitoxin [Clostridium sp.]|nr:type II toxin-antitoxin system HicB family antitoxin [Clostridium sp.]MCM1170638.1 type II toxin-antitoxin system HicB family antitoxin [Clostridium sp.]MCM1209315.1 type II toxin-antitoxin system HicB family antitoxin [Ruminococcus sp.]
MLKVYPAIIHYEDNGYWLEFPDLEGCFTDGKTKEVLMKMAQEAMGLYLNALIEDGVVLPDASDISDIAVPKDCQATYVVVDVDDYHRDTRAVKKMLSIPAWLAKEAEANHISLSKVLQEALMAKMNIV